MFAWPLDEDLSLIFLRPEMSTELFTLCRDNRDYLGQWLPWPPLLRHVDDMGLFIRHAIEGFARGESLHCALEYQGEVVGAIAYNQIDRRLGVVVIGYWLAERCQGKGIITRACRALIQHAFEQMGMEKVAINTAVDNQASRAVCERLGFQLEGINRNAERLQRGMVDHACYGLLRAEWQQREPRG
ncbi:GNAT family N-acetyltransferase [Aeromonas simiae]|uniref:GNAT family N-acetyltransferase n=1 Tax=Aeromonas simiae TaxID=218936 RepID=UPI0005A91069